MRQESHKLNVRLTALIITVFVIAFLFAGCSRNSRYPSQAPSPSATAVVTPPADGAKANTVSYVYTTQKAFALTFSGKAEKDALEQILDKLDEYHIKALFFLSGMRVAEEPDLAKEILGRGHEIGNGTLSGVDLTTLGSYGDIYKEISKANEVIAQKTGVTPKYLMNKGAQYTDDALMAAKVCGLDTVSYRINLQDWHNKSSQEVEDNLLKQITRGSVIGLNTDNVQMAVDSIELIAQAADQLGYSAIPLSDLLASQYERKPLEQIPGWDAVSETTEAGSTPYNLFYYGSRNKKAVSITFDDWGTDLSITRILDILDQYKIKATFFLRGNGVEGNPNLAMAIAQAGHDVANHTYSHTETTNLTPEQVKEEVVKCHRILTEAIQKEPAMLFRPPKGEINETTAKAVSATGMPYISLYDVSPHDWDVNNNAEAITEFIETNVQNGSVILLHLEAEIDTYKALPAIIEYLQKNGYDIIPLSQMIQSGGADVFHAIPDWDQQISD